MKNMMLLSVAVAGCGLISGVAAADDLFAPDWRGEFGTVVAGWDYWGQPGPGAGTVIPGFYEANPGGLGDPAAVAHFGSNTLVHDVLFGRESVLELGFDGSPATLQFGLLNYGNADIKEVVIQITYMAGFGAPLHFEVGVIPSDLEPPWSLTETVPAVVDQTFAHPDGWVTSSYTFTIEPRPAAEGIGIVFTEYPAFVDQVVIDTRSIPGPATLVMLGAGVLAYRRRRR